MPRSDPDWRETHRERIVSPAGAASAVRSGDLVATGFASHTPDATLFALADRKDELRGVQVLTTSALTPVDFWTEPGWEDSILAAPAFLSEVTRQGMAQHCIDFTVVDFALMKRKCDVDVVMMRVTPPDRHGYCSIGTSVWYHAAWVDTARVVIGEVDEALPYMGGAALVHVSQLTHLVVPDEPTPARHLLRKVSEDRRATDAAIAGHVSELVEDGATLQIGPSPMSATIVAHLAGKEGLGIHSETIEDPLIELVKLGVIDGSRKQIHRHVAVGSSIRAIREDLREFIDDNPAFESYGLDYVNDPRTISQHDQMTTINFTLSVDLTGQLASESIGPQMHSGCGGQFDFTIGAMLAKQGKALTCLPSTAASGTISRIVAQHPPGTIVSIPRTWADWVITEHGAVNLRGKTQRERALALTSIAHPDHRAALEAEARRLFWP